MLRRAVLYVDASVFFIAALLNVGVAIPLGFTVLRFADPLWQAGTGEAVIGAALLVAGLRGRAGLSWVALGMSVLGIAIGHLLIACREPPETFTSSLCRSP